MDKQWDIFLSHANEDKTAFVNKLSECLLNRGLSVWYDDFELKIGSKIRESIEDGLIHSTYAIIVLSNNFIKKNWTVKELNGLFSINKKLLPIWHNISKEEIEKFSPLLLNVFALDSLKGAEAIANEIELVINTEKKLKLPKRGILENIIKMDLPYQKESDPYGLEEKVKRYASFPGNFISSTTRFPNNHTVGIGGERITTYELLDFEKNILFKIQETDRYYTDADDSYGFPSPTLVEISAIRPTFDDLILECNRLLSSFTKDK